MDNIETNDTKKKNKIGILGIICIVIAFIIFGFIIYLTITDRELFLFGYMWKTNYVVGFLSVLMWACIIILRIGKPKSKKERNIMILCTVLSVLEIGLLAWAAYDNFNEKADRERLVLSDGNEIFLKERIAHSTIGETRFEHTYMDVYQINGFAAKKLGEIDETYFSNKCLSQDKYTYEYDEASKKLTIICEYGTYGDGFVRLKEEYDTGFWEKEFILE